MKKVFFVALIAVGALTAFKAASNKGTATVDQQQGVFIFVLSKPTADYEYLGSIKVPQKWTGEPHEQLNTALDRLKKDYPKADGIIFTEIDMKKADAIKFKE